MIDYKKLHQVAPVSPPIIKYLLYKKASQTNYLALQRNLSHLHLINI